MLALARPLTALALAASLCAGPACHLVFPHAPGSAPQGSDGRPDGPRTDSRPADSRPPDGPLPDAAPAKPWVKGFAWATGRSVATDGSGNVFLTGSRTGPVDFGGGPLPGAGVTGFLASFTSSGGFRFAKSFGDDGNGVAMDASGNAYVAGSFSGTTDFGGGPVASQGQTDAFLASYSSSGGLRFVKAFGGTGTGWGQRVAVDTTGNTFVAGWFTGTVDFGGGAVTSKGTADAFLASTTSNGGFRFAKALGGSGSSAMGRGAAVDPSGNSFVTGSFTGTVDFGGGPLASNGSTDAFVASFGPSGVLRFAKSFGGANADTPYGVAADGSGNIFVTGDFSETVDFGGGPVTSHGVDDIFLASYGPTGSFRFVKVLGSAGNENGAAVTVDGSGNVYATGLHSGTADFAGATLTSKGYYADIFVASYSSNGAFRFAKSFGGASDDTGLGVAVDQAGPVVVTGFFSSPSVDFGTGSPVTRQGSQDGFLLWLPQP